jgi:hypothetical protein
MIIHIKKAIKYLDNAISKLINIETIGNKNIPTIKKDIAIASTFFTFFIKKK